MYNDVKYFPCFAINIVVLSIIGDDNGIANATFSKRLYCIKYGQTIYSAARILSTIRCGVLPSKGPHFAKRPKWEVRILCAK